MNNRHIAALISVPLILACGVLPATKQAVLIQPAPVYTATAEVKISTATPNIQTAPIVLSIIGGECWNVRSEASANAPILGVLCGGTVEYVTWAANGYIEIVPVFGDVPEYICNQAVGMGDKCQ